MSTQQYFLLMLQNISVSQKRQNFCVILTHVKWKGGNICYVKTTINFVEKIINIRIYISI